MTSINTERTFFKGKRPWSKIKDAVLRDYLPSYLRKVAKLGQQIILIDAFAGPGIFENEKKESRIGSPLIICQAAQKYIPGKYFAIFVNANKKHHEKLEKVIYNFAPKELVKPVLGTASELLSEVIKVLTNQTIFIYLDPFGLKDLDFKLIKLFLQRDISYSTEILINMSMPTLHRLATRKVQQNGRQTEKTKKLNETLTKVLGGDYWKEIMWENSLSPKDKEIKVMEKYRGLLKEHLPYTGSCPVKERREKRTKYFITFCSRHSHAMFLMNDAMCKAYFKYMHEKEYGDTLFKDIDWRKMRDLSPIKKNIIEEINIRSRQSRLEVWYKIIQDHFMRFHSSEYKEAIKQLIDEENLEYENPRNTGRLNDDCILFLDNRNSTSNIDSGFLVKEKVIEYPQSEKKYYSRPKIHFDRYKTIDGKTQILVRRVNDGSIITRFDKTPLPKKFSDVICPHFLELKWAYGCPYNCAWCYLKGTFRFHRDKILPGFKVKDFDKIRLHVEEFLDSVDEPEVLNTGEIADSLMYENGISPFSRFIIPMFEKQRKHRVLFVTKSDRIKNLLEIKPHRQVIVSFSLNAIPVAQRWEKGAPGVINRIEAGKKLSKENYEIRVRIDPMVPIENWQKYYRQLIDLIFSNFIPERITLGSLRGLQSTLNGTKDNTWKRYLRETSSWGKKIDFTTRLKMYLDTIGYLKKKYKYDKIALCKETKAMWQKLSMDYRRIKCNCIW